VKPSRRPIVSTQRNLWISARRSVPRPLNSFEPPPIWKHSFNSLTIFYASASLEEEAYSDQPVPSACAVSLSIMADGMPGRRIMGFRRFSSFKNVVQYNCDVLFVHCWFIVGADPDYGLSARTHPTLSNLSIHPRVDYSNLHSILHFIFPAWENGRPWYSIIARVIWWQGRVSMTVVMWYVISRTPGANSLTFPFGNSTLCVHFVTCHRITNNMHRLRLQSLTEVDDI